MIGGDHTLVVQAEAAGQIEAAGQAAEVGSRFGRGTGEALIVIGAEDGEHGVGLEKQDFMPLIFSADDLEVMARVRSAIDPSGNFNPAKVLPAPEHTRTRMRPKAAPSRIPEGVWV